MSFLKIVDVEIDERTLVPCPRVKSGSISAQHCKECDDFDDFDGVGLMTEAESVEVYSPKTGEVEKLRPILWAEKYAIRCKGMVERRCQAY